ACAGRLPVRSASGRLRAYAALELVVALTAMVLPTLLAACVPALRWAYADGGMPTRFGVIRVALRLTLLGVPAAAMGATFPLAAAWFTRTATEAGALYTANTAGAAIGALAAGFFLIPAIGLRGTTLIAVSLNGLAAVGALWLAWAATTINAENAEPAEISNYKRKKNSLRSPRSLRLPLSPHPVLACLAAAVSGFVALVYEVSWTRLLALVIGPTTYAFATMVASFIAGLALGSAAGTRIARRSPHAPAWLAATLIATAASASAAAWYASSRLPLMVASEVAGPNAVFARILLFQAFPVG